MVKHLPLLPTLVQGNCQKDKEENCSKKLSPTLTHERPPDVAKEFIKVQTKCHYEPLPPCPIHMWGLEKGCCVGGRKSVKTRKCFNFRLHFYERVVVTRKLYTSKLSKSQDLSFFIVYFYTSDTNEWTRSPASSSFSCGGWELINFNVSLTIPYVETNYLL